MSHLHDAYERVLRSIECGHCGWWLEASTNSQAMDAAHIIHDCPAAPYAHRDDT